jgi:RsiW-degrading membrane proteinase PrsW (M82 family)
MSDESKGLVMLIALVLSPAALALGIVFFRRACLPPGQGSFRAAAAAFALGGLGGALILWRIEAEQAAIDPAVRGFLQLHPGQSPLRTLWWGPLREEAVKASVLILFAIAGRLTTGRAGLWLGAATGFGFAAFENHVALLNTASFELFMRTAVERTLLPLHAVTTAVIGGAIGWGMQAGRWRWLPAAIAAGLGLHIAWNAVSDVPLALVQPMHSVLGIGAPDVQDVWTVLLEIAFLMATLAAVRMIYARRSAALAAERRPMRAGG